MDHSAGGMTGQLGVNPMKGTKYQVALSFAGEQRDYVEDVALHLRNRSIAVFYDGFEKRLIRKR